MRWYVEFVFLFPFYSANRSQLTDRALNALAIFGAEHLIFSTRGPAEDQASHSDKKATQNLTVERFFF